MPGGRCAARRSVPRPRSRWSYSTERPEADHARETGAGSASNPVASRSRAALRRRSDRAARDVRQGRAGRRPGEDGDRVPTGGKGGAVCGALYPVCAAGHDHPPVACQVGGKLDGDMLAVGVAAREPVIVSLSDSGPDRNDAAPILYYTNGSRSSSLSGRWASPGRRGSSRRSWPSPRGLTPNRNTTCMCGSRTSMDAEPLAQLRECCARLVQGHRLLHVRRAQKGSSHPNHPHHRP